MFYRFLKRAFDIVASFLGILGTSPIWLVAIIGIEISDPGPVFYRAVRIGKDGKPFSMYKFRSMTVDKTANEKNFKADTSRIFKFGALMRDLKIDELPQLLNVFAGTMSVVGPRPAAADQVHIVRAGRYAVASSVKPGLTGPAALYDYIYGDAVADEEEYERLVLPTRLELEVFYANKKSFAYDIKMIIYTVICILFSLLGKKPVRIFEEICSCVTLPAEEQELVKEHL